MTAPLFLTGATGFLGRHLLPLLLRAGYPVRALVRPGSASRLAPRPGLEVVLGDLLTPATYAPALQGCQGVIHAAGLFRFWGPEARFEAINRQGTQRLAVAAARARVRRLVYLSTLAVIGTPPLQGPITEATPPRPRDAYQRSKYAAEQALRRVAQQSDLEVVILRPGGFYGPGGTYGLNRLLVLDPLRGIRVRVQGGRLHLFPPAFIEDVARSTLRALTQGRAGEVYHLHDRPPTLAEAQGLLTALAGLPSRWWDIPAPLLLTWAALSEAVAWLTRREPFYPLNLRHYVLQDWRAESGKARRELGFVPTPLEEGLRQTVAWAQTFLASRPQGR